MNILLIAYDNESRVSYFPLNIAYIASVCRKAGHEVSIYNQDVYHWPESHLFGLLDKEHFDVVGVGIIGGYYQYRKLLKISEAINKTKNRPFYIIGGHGPSPEPEFFLRKTHADAVVVGEGELTIIELLDAIKDKKGLSSVSGIAFFEGDRFVQTPRKQLISNIDEIPFPAWDLFPINHYALLPDPRTNNTDRVMPVLSGKGCNFQCNFCYRMDPEQRTRTPQGILEEIQVLKKDHGITYIEFVDDLLMSSVQRAEKLCESFIKAKLNVKWFCNGRLNYATLEILKLMKAAGCVFINYGIESMDEEMLRIMNKALTLKQVEKGVENTLRAGISPGLNIIFGNIKETKEALKKGVEFLLKYDDHSQMRTIRPVTPYPGSPLYYYAIKNGLLKDAEDFYENKHINSDLLSVNFTDLSDEEFHRALYEANKTLLKNYYGMQLELQIEVIKRLYLKKDAASRGFRHT